MEFPYLVSPLDALKSVINPEKVNITALPTNDLPLRPTPTLLENQDVCLTFVSADSGEGYIAYNGIRGDRNDLKLQKGGDHLIRYVTEHCGGGKGKTVVVVHAVGPVLVEEWADLDGVRAIIFANLPGQESGNALVCPSYLCA